MKQALSLTIYLLLSTLLCASAVRDSLQQVVRRNQLDTSTVHALYSYGELLEYDQPDSALYYYTRAQSVAREIGYTKGEADFASYALPVYNNRGQYRTGLDLAREALVLYKKLGRPRDLAIGYLNVGSEWQYLSDFRTAADNYLAARSYAEQSNDLRLLRITNNNLASVFLSLSEFNKGRDYALKGLHYARVLQSDAAIASSLYNLATAAVYLKQYDTALVMYNEIELIARRQNDDSGYLDAWLGKAGAYDGLGKYAEASLYFDRVITLARQKQYPEYEMYAYMGLAEHYLKIRNYTAAGRVIDSGLKLAVELGTRFEEKDLLLKGSQVKEQTGDYKTALELFRRAGVLNDSISGENHRIAVANNEARYEFNKKELAIQKLLAEKELSDTRIQQQRIITAAVAGGALLLLLILFLIYRNTRQRQKIQKQRIHELETEKKLTATEAIIQGEEQERLRLAKDLHDGLGGMLSGVKYTLHNMKDHLILTQDNARAFEHSLQLLDSSISEMRRVAHNMMPESLLKFGLDSALRDFCSQLDISGMVKVSYQSFGIAEQEPEKSLSITIYRVVQELLNNTIKHAAAQNIIVQVSAEAEHITLTVEDDGKGFDTSLLQHSGGIGWKNIQSRLSYHNGRLDVRSSPDKGTSVYIEFPLV